MGCKPTLSRSENTGFEKAALAVSKGELDSLELLSRSLFDTVADIRGYARQSIWPDIKKHFAARLVIDPDRIVASVRVVTILWLTYLLWIYVNPPGHSVFVVLTVTIAMAAAMLPMVPATALFFPFMAGCASIQECCILLLCHSCPATCS